MSTQVQIRRGNTAQTAAFTGVVAELTVDTDKKVVVVHDGTTAGGIPLSKESTASTIFNHANGAFDKANSANVLAQAGYNQANTATTSAQAAFDKANQTAQLAFTTVSANGTSLVADANNDTLTITSAVANGIFVSGNSSTDALDIGLINSGVTASGYGDSISVPTFVVDTKGRLTSASNTTIRSGTTSQTGVVQLQDSVTSTSTSNAATPASVKTAYDLATTANNNAVNAGTYANAAFDKANSANVIAQSAFDNSNTKFNSSGGSISGDVSVTGNLTIIGQTIYANTTTALIADNIITLNAAINQASAPTVDAGFEIDRGSSANVSLLWNETSDKWTFTNDGTTYFNIADAGRLDSSFNHANGAFTVANSATTTAQNAYNLANGTAGVANTDFTTLTASAGTYGNASHVTVTTLTANGRVSSITNTSIAIDTAAITSGTLADARLPDTGTAGTYANASHVPVITTDSKGRVTAVTNTAIVISAAAITSGTLAVAQGGTGVTTSTGTGSVVLNTSPTLSSIELGNASDTTLSRSSAGVLAVEGVVVPTISSTSTLTNKTLTLPVIDNIKLGYSTTVTAAGTTTLTSSSNRQQFFTGTTTQTLQLPAPQTMTLGMGFFVVNNSTGAISVIASNSAAVTTIPAGTAALFVSIDLTAGNGAAGWSAEFVGFSSAVLPFGNGGSNNTTYTTGGLLTSNGTAFVSVANTGTAGTYANASHVPVITTDAYGRVSGVTNTAIAIDTAAITSGTIADARLPTKGTAGTYANATHVPVITTDAYGRVTAVTNTAISFPVTSVAGTTGAISNNQILSGLLTVDGVGSGLDADLLDGFSYTAFANATFANTRFSSSGGSITGDVTVTGNLTIVGQTVYANTTTALIADNIITLNAAIGQASAPTVNAGIEVDRGSSANVLLLWNETTDKWQFTNDGSTYFDVADAGRLDSVFSLANGTAGVANTDYTTISTTAGVYGNAAYLPVVTLTSNGRVSSITNTAIAIDTAAITSGTLAVTRGGTGVTTSTGTGAVVLNTAPTLTSINVTNTTVSTSNTTGAITVSGGIGVKGNVSANGIIFDDGTRQTTAASGGATLGDVLALSIALG